MKSSKIHFNSFLFTLFILLGGLFVLTYNSGSLSAGDVFGAQTARAEETTDCSSLDDSNNYDKELCNQGGGGTSGGGSLTGTTGTGSTENPPMSTANSSSSVTVYVEKITENPEMTGTITSNKSSCEIPVGSSTCKTLFTWETINPVEGSSSVTRNPEAGFVTQNSLSGEDVSLSVAYPKSWYFLYNNQIKLAETSVSASCEGDSYWDTGTGKCAIEPTLPSSFFITSSNCTIEANSNSCYTSLNWSVTGVTESFLLTTPTNVTVSTKTSGINFPYQVNYPSRSFFLVDNNNTFDSTTAYANCEANTTWSSSDNKCITNPTEPSQPPQENVCLPPLTQIVSVTCDPQDGVDAISGSVLRSQSKSAYPVCGFETPVTVDNSTYVSDTCVYPEAVCTNGSTNYPDCNNIFCPAPLTQIVEVTCDPQDGVDAISGSVLRSQSKSAYPICEFGYPVTAYNSTYVSDSCKYPGDDGDEGNGGDGEGNTGDPYWITTCGLCDANKVKQCQSVCSENPSSGKLCNGDIDGVRSYTTQIGCIGSSTTGGGTPILNIILTASPDRIFKGKSSTLTWTSEADSCVGDGFVTGNQPNGSYIVKPTETMTYGITCTKGTDTKSASATIKVNTINIIES